MTKKLTDGILCFKHQNILFFNKKEMNTGQQFSLNSTCDLCSLTMTRWFVMVT